MSRLIDGDRLKKEIHENDIMGGLNYEWYIDHAESVDAVEVKHGEWIEKKVFMMDGAEMQSARCSICKKYHTTPYLYYFDSFNYCPNCGAKMKGAER